LEEAGEQREAGFASVREPRRGVDVLVVRRHYSLDCGEKVETRRFR